MRRGANLWQRTRSAPPPIARFCAPERAMIRNTTLRGKDVPASTVTRSEVERGAGPNEVAVAVISVASRALPPGSTSVV